MLRPEIGFPEHDFMKPIFDARRSVRIRAICPGKFLSDFSKFETFTAQELDDMMLFQVHRISKFRSFTFLYLGYARQFFSGKSQIVTSSMNFPGLSLVLVGSLPEKEKLMKINSVRTLHIEQAKRFDGVVESLFGLLLVMDMAKHFMILDEAMARELGGRPKEAEMMTYLFIKVADISDVARSFELTDR
jgi:hypothetical protein